MQRRPRYGGEMVSTGTRMDQLRAGAPVAPLSTGNSRHCRRQNGGIVNHREARPSPSGVNAGLAAGNRPADRGESAPRVAGEPQAPDTHVDAGLESSWDEGSIPSASTTNSAAGLVVGCVDARLDSQGGRPELRRGTEASGAGIAPARRAILKAGATRTRLRPVRGRRYIMKAPIPGGKRVVMAPVSSSARLLQGTASESWQNIGGVAGELAPWREPQPPPTPCGGASNRAFYHNPPGARAAGKERRAS